MNLAVEFTRDVEVAGNQARSIRRDRTALYHAAVLPDVSIKRGMGTLNLGQREFQFIA